jgi:IrrE N-terminal-like domain
MRTDVEERAERVLEGVPPWIWNGETLPVPVADIADSHFGLLVREVEDLAAAPGAPSLGAGQSFSGLLLPGRGEIWVNAAEAREWPPRRRFTIGHELGHWCMHREDGKGIYCRKAVVAMPDPERPAGPPAGPFEGGSHPQTARLGGRRSPNAEEEANLFAAALLMPARLVERHYRRDRDFSKLCEAFEVSGAAMGRRLRAVI